MSDKKYNKQIGANIRKKRRDREITQVQLGQFMNVHRNTIRNWESGITEVSTQNLDIIAKFFGISINLLLPKSDAPQESAKKRK